ncbi:MAG: hypothetical protein HYS87_00600 [Candidatus Colwellbacteria bacterium]|nr:hypothetical protein [Candidatus Colwellbacteria bacterium]
MLKEAPIKSGPADWIVASLLPELRDAFAKILAVLPPDEKHRSGGYFCLRPLGLECAPVVVSQIGTITDPVKARKYFELAQEKANRLDAHIKTMGHKSSWQSRDPAKNQWGGAIFANGWIFSFSGLPELADEAAMVLVAMRFGFLNPRQVAEITAKSLNPFVDLVLTKIMQRA